MTPCIFYFEHFPVFCIFLTSFISHAFLLSARHFLNCFLSLFALFLLIFILVGRFLITAFPNFLLCLLPTLFSPSIILFFFCPLSFHFSSYRDSSVDVVTRLWDRHSENCGHILPVACYCVVSKTLRPGLGPTRHLFKFFWCSFVPALGRLVRRVDHCFLFSAEFRN